MILGQNRTPYSGPEAASGAFRPGLPGTGFYSHFNPFIQVMERMPAVAGMYRPGLNPNMGPGPAPTMPAPPPVVTTPAPTTAPSAGGMAGSGFGSTGGTRMHSHVNPYMVMRQGMIPGVMPSGANIRAGYQNVSARVDRSFPFQTAPLPPPPPPPAPPVATAPGGVKGLMGALFGDSDELGRWRGRRPRRHRWWQINPPSTQEQVYADLEKCETYPPDLYGIKKTVCGGRVTRYEDAQGNVRIPGQLPPGFAGW